MKNNNVKIGSIGGGKYDNLTSNFGLNNMSGVNFFWVGQNFHCYGRVKSFF